MNDEAVVDVEPKVKPPKGVGGHAPPPAVRPGPADERQRQEVLTAGAVRDLHYESHPLVKNAVRIATKPVREAYEVVAQVVVHRDPGTCLIAEFRVGKTTTMLKIVDELSRTFPNLPVGWVNAKSHDVRNHKTYYTDLLSDFKHSGARSGNTEDRRIRVLNMFLAHPQESDGSRLRFCQGLLLLPSSRYVLIQWHPKCASLNRCCRRWV